MLRDLKADLELCNKATHGKWQASYDDDIKDDVRVCQVENGECVCCLALMGNYDYDLGEWRYGDIVEWRANADFIAAARAGWPEAIERAIKAESKNTKEYEFLYNVFDKVKDEAEQLKADNAALREENDHQRHSIQQLSAQVAELREGLEYALEQWEVYADEGLCDDDSYLLDTDDMEGVKYREIAEILSRPNPGADLLAKIERLEAVAEAAQNFMDEEGCPTGHVSSCRYSIEECKSKICPQEKLAKALAALEGPADE